MMTFDQAYDYCLQLPSYDKYGDVALKPGFDRIECLLQGMSVPVERLPVIHVGGTNGKGSTCFMISAILQSAGFKVGLHTSPHVVSVAERMRINGVPISENHFAGYVEEFLDVLEECKPSFFEATLALSLLHFHREAVGYAVVEVGLGGRLDATNILSPIATVITDIDLDHTHILGSTVAEIALEKAGIIKPEVPLFFGRNHIQAREVLLDVAAARDVPVFDARNSVEIMSQAAQTTFVTRVNRYNVQMDLQGDHQTRNAALAIMVSEHLLERDAAKHAVIDALQNTSAIAGIRGRLEVVQATPLVIVDVGHNPSGIEAALNGIDVIRDGNGRLFVGIGLMKTKDAATIFEMLQKRADHVYPIAIDSPRAASLQSLELLAAGSGLPYHPCEYPDQARSHFLDIARPDDALLFVGSHQVAERVLGYGDD